MALQYPIACIKQTMDQGAFVKLSFLVVILVAFTSFLSPFIAEARQKQGHHINKGHHHVKYSPLPSPPSLAPTPTPAPNGGTPPSLSSAPPQSSTYPDQPLLDAPSPPPPEEEQDDEIITPPPPYDPYNVGTPSEYPTPYDPYNVGTPSVDVPAYKPHGCKYNCTDSNDCDWPCTVCCWNGTCCYDWPELPYE
ncbi:leucine-rich repeat extensin-like protein 3 [Chenopodium quinoa]|uniref:leucine-rich repeat extensin-like protein 3 n=1 Tax=Chenopodium quinoa TaxID=63459 RepID=UPI000B785293|nr:leucine-rich repeat extensin-like protein 3 [Chenopodium quinoa]